MKLALNGALTIGTLDGANVEISERIGSDNIFIFGLTASEVEATRRLGLDCRDTITASPTLSDALGAVSSGVFSPDEPGRYRELVEALTNQDDFLVIKDFDSYWQAQRSVDERWRDPSAWWRSTILSTARAGWFSSDRTIREYAEEVWRVPLA
jgi:starch phosphorylase